MKKKHIIKMNSEQLDNYPGSTDWKRLRAMTDEEAYQNALDDPDNLPLSKLDLQKLKRVSPSS